MPLRWAILSLAIFQQLNSTQTILTEAPPCASTALNLGKQSRLSQLQPSVPKTDLQASPGQWYLRCYVGNMCKELRGRVTKSSKHLASAKFILQKKKKIQHRFVQTQHGPRLTNENNTQVLSTGMGPFQAHWLSSHPSPIWSWAPWSISQALILITWYCLSRPSPFFTLKPKRWSL